MNIDIFKKQCTINKLKNEIAQNDYKIRKIYEYTMVGKPAPYDIYEIHRTDELKRQEINKLENEILQLKS